MKGCENMGFWSLMNWVAWGMSALVLLLILLDFIKVETEKTKK